MSFFFCSPSLFSKQICTARGASRSRLRLLHFSNALVVRWWLKALYCMWVRENMTQDRLRSTLFACNLLTSAWPQEPKGKRRDVIGCRNVFVLLLFSVRRWFNFLIRWCKVRASIPLRQTRAWRFHREFWRNPAICPSRWQTVWWLSPSWPWPGPWA